MHILPPALFVWAFCTRFGSALAYVAREDSPGGSGDSLAASTPSFSFNSIAEMETCKPATISWSYSPTNSDVILQLTLSITNDGVAQPSAPASTTVGSFPTPGNVRRYYRSRRADIITQTITNPTVNPGLHAYTWPSVNVTAGWYIVTASLSFTSPIQSQPFYVTDGPDTSCLAGAGAATSSTPGSSSSASATSTGDGSAPSLPVDAVSSLKVNRGAIAGGVIGGLAVIAAALAAYFYLRYASASASASSTSGGAPAARRSTRRRQWGGLNSIDSKTDVYPGPSPRRAPSDPVRPRDSDVYVIGNVGIDSRPSRINDEEADELTSTSYFSPSQEKISASPPRANPFSDAEHIDEDGVPLDLISPLPGNPVTRNSSTSTSSYMNSNFSRPRSHPSSPYSSPTSPTPEAQAPFSASANAQSTSSLSHPDPAPAAYPPSPSPAYPSGTSQLASADSSAGTPSPVPGPAPRRSSAGVEPSRRTPRKPVPQYNPVDPALQPPPPALPLPAAPPESDSSSSREGSVRSGDVPQLGHKASFGADGRAVHYLIPDMPPLQRE